MSSTLDLNGATVTLSNSVYTYYQITDTSVSHNGKLIINPGVTLRFDNKSGAGFSSVASAIEIYCNGTATSNSVICSADPNPTNLWSMPNPATMIDAKWTEFSGYSGQTSADYWAFDNCLFSGSRFCSVEDIYSITGNSNQRIDIGRMIELATADVQARLSMYGLGGSGSGAIRVATMKITVANLLTRFRMDGTKMKLLVLDKITMGDDIDKAIAELRHDAELLITQYIKTNTTQKQSRRHLRILNRS